MDWFLYDNGRRHERVNYFLKKAHVRLRRASVQVKIWACVTFWEPYYLRIRTKVVLESDKKGKITSGPRTICKRQQRKWMSSIFT